MKFVSLLLLAIIATAVLSTPQTEKACFDKGIKESKTNSACTDKCMVCKRNEWNEKYKNLDDFIEPVAWHECHLDVCKSLKGTEEAAELPTNYKECLAVAVKDAKDNQHCNDTCMVCEKEEWVREYGNLDDFIDPVAWHKCHLDTCKEVRTLRSGVKDQKCWDTCQSEHTDMDPTVVYQICFFQCGPKPTIY